MTPDELRAATIEHMKSRYPATYEGWKWDDILYHSRCVKLEYDLAMRDAKQTEAINALDLTKAVENESRGLETGDPKRPKRRTNSKGARRTT